MILVIDRKGSILSHDNGCLLVDQPGMGKRRFPFPQLEQVVVYGNPILEAAACRALAAAGVPLILLATRGADNMAMLGQGLATQLPLRRLQHRCADRPDAALAMARWIVRAKLRSYDLPVAQLSAKAMHIPAAEQGNSASESQQVTINNGVTAHQAFVQQRDQALQTLEDAPSIVALSGIEGGVARGWFTLLASQLPGEWKFKGRNRRPPRDPVNALLSLGYTLLQSPLRQAALSAGLDPSLGFLHQTYPAREALVLDLLEPFRAAVDQLVIEVIASGQLEPGDFHYRDAQGCRLNKNARPVFYNAWAQHLEAWPGSDTPAAEPTPLREQAGGLIRRLRQQLNDLVPSA